MRSAALIFRTRLEHPNTCFEPRCGRTWCLYVRLSVSPSRLTEGPNLKPNGPPRFLQIQRSRNSSQLTEPLKDETQSALYKDSVRTAQ